MIRKKIRFNIVDVLIILAIIAAVLFSVSAISQKKVDSENSRAVLHYVIRTQDMSDGMESNFAIGSRIYTENAKVYLGTVTEIEVRPAYHNGIDKNTGESVAGEIVGRKTVYLTVDADAELINHSYYIDGYEMYVGNAISAVTPNISFDGECISITVMD